MNNGDFKIDVVVTPASIYYAVQRLKRRFFFLKSWEFDSMHPSFECAKKRIVQIQMGEKYDEKNYRDHDNGNVIRLWDRRK